ncbi:MAG: LysR family transcriptional regulator [Pseudonocardiaceae bacterium]|nr:LysR family transcriptional regulator [Pseudonocardiaceae bacterium]
MPLPDRTPELKALDLLVSVAECGSLGQAARRHGISQPAASMRVTALERQLGLVLLDRGTTGSRLTATGATVVDWARQVLDAAGALLSGVRALHADQRGRLTVAASVTIAEHRVPHWLISLHNQAPQMAVALRVGNSQQVTELVRGQEARLGFVEGPSAPTGLRSRSVDSDELVVVVAPGHRWAKRRRPLTVEELAAVPLITREPGSGTREAIWELLRTADRHAEPAAELGSTAAIKAAVGAGEAPAVMSRLDVAAELRERRLVAVSLADGVAPRRQFRAIWLPENPPSGPSAALLAIAGRFGTAAVDR